MGRESGPALGFRRSPRRALPESDSGDPERLTHLLFHAVTRSKLKLLRRLVVFIDDTAVGSRELDGPRHDRFKHGLEIKGGAHRLAYFTQSFHLPDRFDQLARPFLQLGETTARSRSQ